MRFTVDSNVLIYSVDLGTPAKHELAIQIMIAAQRGNAFIAGQALGEFFAVFRRRFPDRFAVAIEQAARWASLIPVAETRPEHVLAAARQSHDHKMQFWDCVIWQVAREERAAVLLSEDMHDGLRLDGLSVINPFAEANAAFIKRLIGEANA